MRKTAATITDRELAQLYAEITRLRGQLEAPKWPTYRLSVPAPCDWISLNHRSHHMAKAQATAQWRKAASQWARRSRTTLPKGLDAYRITATVQRSDNRKSDAHNRTPVIKAVIDGLVDAGLFLDDNDKHLKALTTVAGARLNPKVYPFGALTVRISDLSGEA